MAAVTLSGLGNRMNISIGIPTIIQIVIIILLGLPALGAAFIVSIVGIAKDRGRAEGIITLTFLVIAFILWFIQYQDWLIRTQ